MKTVCTLVFVLMLVLVVYLMHYRAWRIAFVKAAPRNSRTHAELIDGDRRWWIEKRTRNDYRREWHDVTVEKYTATDTNDLDLVKGWGFRALLEMEDPAHRDAWCLENFHKVWDHEKPFSGESFCDWIDYGSGKQVETTEYTRRALNRRSYYLMNVTEVEGSVVDFNVFTIEGKEDRIVVHLSFSVSGEPVPTGMVATTIASAVPTPGGIGAVEAALVLALQAIGVDEAIAWSATLLFRLISYWMPIIPGAIGLKVSERRGLV